MTDRVEVAIDVARVLWWPTSAASGKPTVLGAAAPAPPDPQAEPGNGTGPRVTVRKVAKAASSLPHRLLAYRQADGFPTALPFDLLAHDEHGLTLRIPEVFPIGDRRAGLLAHAYRPQLVGMTQRVCTGWCQVEGTVARYAPHTSTGFSAPPNKTLLLLTSGLMARTAKRKQDSSRSGASRETDVTPGAPISSGSA